MLHLYCEYLFTYNISIQLVFLMTIIISLEHTAPLPPALKLMNGMELSLYTHLCAREVFRAWGWGLIDDL